jgi:RNase P/RNase MRP subunit p30
LNKEIKTAEGVYKSEQVEESMFINSDKIDILAVLNSNPKAVVFPDLKINKKALQKMQEKGIILCIPTSAITSTSGLTRSKMLYLAAKLLKYAKSIKLEVSFATLAKTNLHLCSYMQMIEIAKLIGADEEYARNSISEINKSMVLQ